MVRGIIRKFLYDTVIGNIQVVTSAEHDLGGRKQAHCTG